MTMKAIIVGLLLVLASCRQDNTRIVNHQDTIERINQEATTWKAEATERFADMTLEDVKQLLGTRKTPQDKKLPLKLNSEQDNVDQLPENFDAREQWKYCDSLQEVRDQSNCGSCWAFGSVEAMSDRICIATEGKLQVRISAENLVACCSSCGDGCDGGWPSAAWDYFKSHGLPTGGLYGDNKTCQPYSFKPCDHHVSGKYGPCPSGESKTPKCSHSCNSQYSKKFNDDLFYGQSSYSVGSSEEEIMKEIYNHGSVTGAFTVYEDFPLYKSGVYKRTSRNALGGHAIKVIGWGVENGTKYWLCVNSWNEGWGDNGTFKILRGENHCGIEEEIVAGLVKVPKSFLKYLQ